MSRSKKNWDYLVDSRGNYRGGLKGIGYDKGDPGAKGEKGFGDKGSKGDKGTKGLKGIQGNSVIGPEGPKGDKGEGSGVLNFKGSIPNDAYLPGIADPETGDVWLSVDSSTLWVWNGNKWVELGGVAAPLKGEKGPKGEKGSDGPKGDQGLTGGEGAKGDSGPKGDDGDKGDKGDKGVGEKGAPGVDGTKGNDGEKGSKGDVGGAAPLFEYQGEVANSAALPGPSGATGHVYYVTDIDKYVVSDGTSWRNLAAPGLTPNLQQVTDSGAVTNKNVQIGSLIKLNTGSSVHELEAVDGNTDPLNSWIYTTMPGSGTVHGAMASTNGTWIAVKDSGSPDICRSTDNGNTWTGVRNSNNQGWLYVDTDDNGTWCACSYNGRGIYRSTDDGLTWTQVISSGDWQQVKCDKNGVWIAAAGHSSPLKRSIDGGATWSNVGGTFPCKAIAYDGEGKWMALGYTTQSKMKRSTDGGATWTDLTFPNARWYDCAHANGTWIAVNDDKGTSQRVYRSTNFGSGWSYQSSGVVGGLWQSIAADGYGNWMIRSLNGYTNISKDDGSTWISSPTASAASYELFYKNGYWGMSFGGKVAKLVTDRASNDSSLEFNGDLVATRNNLQPLIDAINAKANSDAIIHDYYPSTGISNQSQFNSWVVNQTMRIIDDLQKIFEGRAPD